MKLVDLNPRWVDELGRQGLGLVFDCPAPDTCGCPGKHVVLFLDPLDGGRRLTDLEMDSLPPYVQAGHPGSPVRRWHRVGSTFEELSLSPSIECAGGWRAWLAGGRLLMGGPRPRALSPATLAWLAGEGEPAQCARIHATPAAAEACAEQLAIEDPDYGM